MEKKVRLFLALFSLINKRRRRLALARFLNGGQKRDSWGVMILPALYILILFIYTAGGEEAYAGYHRPGRDQKQRGQMGHRSG